MLKRGTLLKDDPPPEDDGREEAVSGTGFKFIWSPGLTLDTTLWNRMAGELLSFGPMGENPPVIICGPDGCS